MNRHYRWWVVGMLWVVCFFNYADRQAFFAIFPTLKAEFGFNAVQLGLLGSAFAWIYAIGGPLAGFIGDRASRKNLILGSCLFWSVTTVLTGVCGGFGQFVTVRALTGLGECIYFPATLSLLSDYHGKSTRSFAFSIHQSAVYIGCIGGSCIGACLAEAHGWRWSFYLFGGAGIALVFVLSKFLREPIRTGNTQDENRSDTIHPLSLSSTLTAIACNKTAVLLMIVFLGANFVAMIFMTWVPLFLFEKFHLGLAQAGFTGSAFVNLAAAVSVPFGGRIADALARRYAGGRITTQALGLLGGSIFIVFVGLTGSLSILIVSISFFGLFKGLYDANIFASLYDVVEPRTRATAAGVMNAVGWCGGALGPVAAGFATQYGRHGSDMMANMSEAIALAAVIFALDGLLLIVALSTVRRDVDAALTCAV